MALINSLTTKPKLNVSNIKSPFGSGSSIPKISAGPIAKALGGGISKPKTSPLNIDTFQIKTNIKNIDEQIDLRRRIDMLSGAVFTTNQQLSEVNAVMQDIGGALALDFANRIAEQKQDNKALKAQASADKRSSAESNLEGKKKIGKGIGSGVTNVGKASTGLTLGGIMDAAKLLAAGIAINALWPNLKKIFDWSMNNLDKILLVGGALVGLNLLGSLGGIVSLFGLIGGAKVLAILAVIAGAVGTWNQIKNKDKNDKILKENTKKSLEKYGFDEEKFNIEQTNQWWDFLDWFPDKFKVTPKEMHDGGIVTGSTNEVPAVLERGEAVIPKELVSTLSQKPGINLIEMDLPPITIPSKQKKVPLEETTNVVPISSINILNPYMTKTPELHGILV